MGLSAYPASQHHHHHHHHHHKHHSEQHNSSMPHYATARPPQQHQHYHQQQQRVNGDPERDRHRRMTSPEVQMRPPPHRAPHGASHSGSSTTHPYTRVALAERHSGGGGGGRQAQRRNENHTVRPTSAVVGRRDHYQRVTAHKSDSLLQYNSLDRGLARSRDGGVVQQQTGQSIPNQLPPSGSEVRSLPFQDQTREVCNSPNSDEERYTGRDYLC